MERSSITVPVQGTKQVCLTLSDEASGASISYASSNPYIATVSGSGLTATVTGIVAGTATITVTVSKAGRTETADISVIVGAGDPPSTCPPYPLTFTVTRNLPTLSTTSYTLEIKQNATLTPSIQITSTHCTDPWTHTGALPPGMYTSVSDDTYTIQGTPETTGEYNYTITRCDQTATVKITVIPADATPQLYSLDPLLDLT